MLKFFRKEKKIIDKNKYKDSSIDRLNQEYDSIVGEYTKGMFVNPKSNDLSDNLESMKFEVESRLNVLKEQIKNYESQHNESIIEGKDFDVDSYSKVKNECFKLESLYNSINERLGAIKETIGKKL